MELPRIIVEPKLEPVTVQEAKNQLRLEHGLDDAQVRGYIVAARRRVEKVCWRKLVVQTVELTLPAFPEGGELVLPDGHLANVADMGSPTPASPVEFLKYLDSAGALQTLATNLYEVDSSAGERSLGVLRPVYDGDWPVARTAWNAVQVRYTVGWNVENVPEELKQAVLLLVTQLYEDRPLEQLGGAGFNALVEPYRFLRVFG